MVSAAARTKAVVLLLLIHSLLLLSLFLGGCVWSLFCCAVFSVISSFAIILLGKIELVTFLKLSSWRFLAVQFVHT